MLSRALSLAAVTLLIGCFATGQARAQAQNLEAGKSPSQIFAGTCNACHKSPRGLLKTVPAGSLPGFLRQHYTTSPDMASLLSGFLISNGATDTRYGGGQAKDGKEAKQEAKPSGPADQLDRFGHRQRPAPQEAIRPDTDGQSAQGEPGRLGRNAKRLARPGEAPAADGQTPVQAAIERGPDSRRLSAKQKLGKRGKPDSEETPKTESAKTDAGKEEPKSETAKVESGRPENPGSSGEGKAESAKFETPKETGGGESPVLRADPVPPVTPAPPASSPTVSAAVSASSPEAATTPAAPPPVPPAPPAVTAAAPPPVAPAGPPAPPISQ
jgi:hypothetical protein